MHVTAPEDLYVVALDRYVRKGERVEVTAEVGNQLVEQGWTSARSKAAKKAAAKKTAAPTTEVRSAADAAAAAGNEGSSSGAEKENN